MSDDDFEIEDLLENFEKKKDRKKNTSKDKGNRGERQLAEVFAERFEGEKFFRVVGSGNRWSHVELTEAARSVFTGDIVCPPHFNFVVECKYGYADIELCGVFLEGHKQFEEWLKKARRDANSLEKWPILCCASPVMTGWPLFLTTCLSTNSNSPRTSSNITLRKSGLSWHWINFCSYPTPFGLLRLDRSPRDVPEPTTEVIEKKCCQECSNPLHLALYYEIATEKE